MSGCDHTSPLLFVFFFSFHTFKSMGSGHNVCRMCILWKGLSLVSLRWKGTLAIVTNSPTFLDCAYDVHTFLLANQLREEQRWFHSKKATAALYNHKLSNGKCKCKWEIGSCYCDRNESVGNALALLRKSLKHLTVGYQFFLPMVTASRYINKVPVVWPIYSKLWAENAGERYKKRQLSQMVWVHL